MHRPELTNDVALLARTERGGEKRHTSQSAEVMRVEQLEARQMMDAALGVETDAEALLVSFPGTAEEVSLRNGAALTQGSDGEPAYEFGGGDDYVRIEHEPSLDDFGKGDFTIALSASFSRPPGNFDMLFLKNEGPPTWVGVMARRLGNGHIQFGVNGGAAGYHFVETLRSISDMELHQIVFSREGRALHIFMDGTGEETKISEGAPGDYDGSNKAPVLFGGIEHASDPLYFLAGRIERGALFSRAHTPEEVNRLLAPPQPDPASDPALVDAALAGRTEAPLAPASIIPIQPLSDPSFSRALKGDAALSPEGVLTLDGGGSVVIPHDPSLKDFGKGDFTIGVTARFLRPHGAIEMLLMKNAGPPSWEGIMVRRLDKGQIQFGVNGGATGYHFVETLRSISDMELHQIVFSREERTLRIFLDGTEEETKITEGAPGNHDAGNNAPIVVGKHPTEDVYFAKVVLQDLLLLPRALTPAEAALSPRELLLRLSGSGSAAPVGPDPAAVDLSAPSTSSGQAALSAEVDAALADLSQPEPESRPAPTRIDFSLLPHGMIRSGETVALPGIGEVTVTTGNGSAVSIGPQGLIADTAWVRLDFKEPVAIASLKRVYLTAVPSPVLLYGLAEGGEERRMLADDNGEAREVVEGVSSITMSWGGFTPDPVRHGVSMIELLGEEEEEESPERTGEQALTFHFGRELQGGWIRSGDTLEVPGGGKMTVTAFPRPGRLPLTERGVHVADDRGGTTVRLDFSLPIRLEELALSHATTVPTLRVQFLDAEGNVLGQTEQGVNGRIVTGLTDPVSAILLTTEDQGGNPAYFLQELAYRAQGVTREALKLASETNRQRTRLTEEERIAWEPWTTVTPEELAAARLRMDRMISEIHEDRMAKALDRPVGPAYERVQRNARLLVLLANEIPGTLERLPSDTDLAVLARGDLSTFFAPTGHAEMAPRSQPKGLMHEQVLLRQADQDGLAGTVAHLLQREGIAIADLRAEDILRSSGNSHLVATLQKLQEREIAGGGGDVLIGGAGEEIQTGGSGEQISVTGFEVASAAAEALITATRLAEYTDESGVYAYYVSRPLQDPKFAFASHNFIVTNARFLGDPRATVHSFGRNDSGELGRVDASTTNEWSSSTYAADVNAWVSLGSSAPGNPVHVVRVPAASSLVHDIALSLIENQNYVPTGGPGGSNSNSAAQAIVDMALCQHMPPPDGDRSSPGTGDADEIQFSVEYSCESDDEH